MIPLGIVEKKISDKGDLKTMYYLSVLRQERLDFDQMCELIAERTTLSAYEVEFVLSELQDIAIENLRIGRGIELGRLGCIEPSINVMAVENIEDINLKTIKKARLIYKPSKTIKTALKKLKFKIKQ